MREAEDGKTGMRGIDPARRRSSPHAAQVMVIYTLYQAK